MSLDTICDDMLRIIVSYGDCRAKTKLCYVNKRLSNKYFEYNYTEYNYTKYNYTE